MRMIRHEAIGSNVYKWVSALACEDLRQGRTLVTGTHVADMYRLGAIASIQQHEIAFIIGNTEKNLAFVYSACEAVIPLARLKSDDSITHAIYDITNVTKAGPW